MNPPQLLGHFSAMCFFALSFNVAAAASVPIGLQLYSVRNEAKTDLDGALAKVAAWGITDVETAGFYGLSAEEFQSKLAHHGLHAVGAHYGYVQLQKDLGGVIREARILGVKYIICSNLPDKTRRFDGAYAKEVAANFNVWGRRLRDAGIRLGYHTHGSEFSPAFPGSTDTGLDVLIKATDPEVVCFEMDVFWVWSAGQDPRQWLTRYPNRWELLHLKDMRRNDDRTLTGSATPADNVPIGTGQIPWQELMPLFRQDGIRYYLIEDETSDPDRSVPIGLNFFKQLKS